MICLSRGWGIVGLCGLNVGCDKAEREDFIMQLSALKYMPSKHRTESSTPEVLNPGREKAQ